MSMVGGMGRGGFYHLQDRVSLTPAERGRRGQEEVGGQRPAIPPTPGGRPRSSAPEMSGGPFVDQGVQWSAHMEVATPVLLPPHTQSRRA
jgi:hypothetical protein